MRIINTAFFIFLLLPSFSSALTITEVMYDLQEGPDNNREWVEIYNESSDSINLLRANNIRLTIEGDKNPHLITSTGNGLLCPGEIAVIVDNEAKFIGDNPTYSGKIFDSSFSLKNSGTKIRIEVIGDNPSVLSNFTYDSSLGGNGDGNTLNRNSNSGDITASTPTPGSANGKTSGIVNCSDINTSTSDTTTTTSGITNTASNNLQSTSTSSPTKPSVTNKRGVIIAKDNVLTGVEFNLYANIYENNELIRRPRLIWNFGDGTSNTTTNPIHKYKLPGEYLVVAESDRNEIAIRKIINAEKPNLELNNEEAFTQIINNHSFEINISGWQIRANKDSSEAIFEFPNNTFLLANKTLNISHQEFNRKPTDNATLYTPDGTVIRKQEKEETIIQTQVTQTIPTAQTKQMLNQDIETKTNKPTPSIDKTNNVNISALPIGSTENNTVDVINKTNNIPFAIWLLLILILILIAITPLVITKLDKTNKKKEVEKNKIKKISDKIEIE